MQRNPVFITKKLASLPRQWGREPLQIREHDEVLVEHTLVVRCDHQKEEAVRERGQLRQAFDGYGSELALGMWGCGLDVVDSE